MNIRELTDDELRQHSYDRNKGRQPFESRHIDAEIKRRRGIQDSKGHIESAGRRIEQWEQWIAETRAEIAKEEKRIARLEKAP